MVHNISTIQFLTNIYDPPTKNPPEKMRELFVKKLLFNSGNFSAPWGSFVSKCFNEKNP